MSKAKIIDKNSIDNILSEKNLLSELHHPFIVNMIYSFQDHEFLYLVMDLLPGGNLRYHLSIKNTFKEKQIKFLIGCIMIGLKYIHGQNILHRDIKPENLVFDNNGYLRITDFGIAKHYVVNNKKDSSGTVGYLAPEVLCNVNHNFSIDYYAVGIITYELMYGHRPYLGKNKNEIKELILTRQAEIGYYDLPEGFSNEIADFINRLIQRKPRNRLGKNSINEVIKHPWFDGLDWENIRKKKLKAPYIPKTGDNFDNKYCEQSNKIGTDTIERYKKILMDDDYDLIFKEFNCNKIPDELKGYNSKKINDSLYGNYNNLSSNISTTSISRNNRNEHKTNNLKGHQHIPNNNAENIINKNLFQNKHNEFNDLDNSILKKIASLDKTLNNIALNSNNKKTINNFNINKINLRNKQNKNGTILNNRNNINSFRNKNNFNNGCKTYRKDNLTKRNFNNENMVNNYIEKSGTINNYNYSKNKKNNYDKINKVSDDSFFKNNFIEGLNNKKNEHVNRNMSMSNLILNKTKNLINNSILEEHHRTKISFNNKILKNMKYQYQEKYPTKRNKYISFLRENSGIQRNSINDNNNNISQQYNNNINNNYTIYYNKINNNNNSIFNSNNDSAIKRNASISIPNCKSKRDYIRKEILKGSTTYFNNNNSNQNKSNVNEGKNKKNYSTLMSSIINSKKGNLSGNSIINKKKILSSNNSMNNLKLNHNLIREGKISNCSSNISKQKANLLNTDRILKNISMIEKKFPFENLILNKKKGVVLGNEIYYSSYGKFNKINDINDRKCNENDNLNNNYLSARYINKIIKNNVTRINYHNNKNLNDILNNYRKNIQ